MTITLMRAWTFLLCVAPALSACRGVSPHIGILPPALSERPREADPTRAIVDTSPPPDGTPASRTNSSVSPSAEVSAASVLSWLLAGASTGGLPLIGLFGTFEETKVLGVDSVNSPGPEEPNVESSGSRTSPLELIPR